MATGYPFDKLGRRLSSAVWRACRRPNDAEFHLQIFGRLLRAHAGRRVTDVDHRLFLLTGHDPSKVAPITRLETLARLF